ncbi:MAG: hypothetical protein ABUL47_04475, partial [Leifsonia sp.]
MADHLGVPGVTEQNEPDVVVASAPEPRSSRVGGLVVAIVFGLFFAYNLFQAISNLIALPRVYEAYGYGDLVPWWLLIVGVVLPPLVFVAAYLVARRQTLFARVLVFAVALAADFALALSLYTLAPLLLA